MAKYSPRAKSIADEFERVSYDTNECRKLFRHYFSEFGDVLYNENAVSRDFAEFIKANHSRKERSALSDILSPYYSAKIGDDYPFGFGHDKKYWKVKNNDSIEIFANMMMAVIAAPKAADLIRKYLPNSYQIFLDMIKEASR